MARDTYGEPGEGGGGIGTTTPERPKVYTAIEDGTVIPYVIGTCRVPPILMYQGAFVATTPSWTTVSPITLTNAQDEFNDADFFRVAGYRSAVFALAANPIQGLVSWWRGKEKVTPGLLTKLGVYRAEWNGTLGLTHYTQEDTSAAIVLGTSNPTWTPNAYDPTANGQAWEGVAQLRCLKLALTERGEIPDLAVEVRGFGVTGSGEKDASARDAMEYLLGLLGLSGSSIQLDTGIDGQAASSYARWCTVNDWRVSGIVGKMTVKEAIESLAKSTFSTLTYSEGKVKVFPLGAETYTANSATYTPPTPIAIDATDYAELDVDQTADDEVFNTWTVKYADRETNGLYEPRFIQYQDAAHAATSAGVRVTEYESPWLKKRERAFRLAQYLAKESIYQRTIARFTLGQTYALLEPGDLISLDIFGTTRTLRIKSCDHQPGGRIAIEATEVPAGSSTPIDLVPGYASQEAGVSWNSGRGSTGLDGKADTDLGNVAPGSVGGGNLLRNSSFEADSDADGVADGWGAYASSDPVTVTIQSSGGVYGGKYQRVAWTGTGFGVKGLQTDAGKSVGGKEAGVRGWWRLGVEYVVSVWARASLTGGSAAHYIAQGFNVAPTELRVIACPAISGSWQRYVFGVRWDTSVPSSGELYFTISDLATGYFRGDAATGYLELDAARVVEGMTDTAYAPMPDEVLPGTVGTPELSTAVNDALTLAGTKAAVYYQSSAPTGGTYVAGDLWFNTDTSTNCPDTNCKGHAADGSGNPTTGAAPHRGLYWAHRWNGSAWVSGETTALLIASEIAAGAIGVDKCSGNVFHTSNYQGSGSGDSEYATRGAKMRQNASGAVPALLVDPAGLKIGQTTIANAWFAGKVVFIGWALSSGGVYTAGLDNSTSGVTASRVNLGPGYGLRVSLGSRLPSCNDYVVTLTPIVNSSFVHVQPVIFGFKSPLVSDFDIAFRGTASGDYNDPASTNLSVHFTVTCIGVNGVWG